jgi:nitrogen fixation protein FixH
MNTRERKPAEFTGRHMLAIMLAFFGVIIAVNLVMATLASKSWTGLVVKNTYVASQQFNRKAEAGRKQAALGWTGELAISGGEIRYVLRDQAGSPVEVRGASALFRRPAYEAEDQTIALEASKDGAFVARHSLRDGVWIAEIDADIGAAAPYRDVRRLVLTNGEIR